MLQLWLTVASQGPLSKRVKAWFAQRMPDVRTVFKPWRCATHLFEPTFWTVEVGLSEGWVTESFPLLGEVSCAVSVRKQSRRVCKSEVVPIKQNDDAEPL